MKLENVTAEIRPRGRWESIDLGCALVRENFGKIMSAWFMVVVPIWVGMIALSQLWPWPEGRPWMALLACWMVMPVVDRIPLYVLSRALFGEEVQGIWRVAPRIIGRGWLRATTFGRFSLNRGLALPVAELEGLRGKDYKARVRLLERNGGGGVFDTWIIGVFLVLATMFSALFIYWSLLGLFGDEVVIENFWVKHVLESEADFLPIPYVWVLVALYLLAVTLVEPFVVGAGFAIYINSRTITEGWDIELAFRRINDRLRGIVERGGKFMGMVLVGMLCLMPGKASAENEQLERVLASEDFIVHEKVEQIPVEQGKLAAPPVSLGISGIIGDLIFWLIIIAVAAGLVWFLVKNSHLFRYRGAERVKVTVAKAQSVMGMELTPESLPEDIAVAARQAWRNGDPHLSLSLLYRGAISWMVHQEQLPICESDTESDCVRHAGMLERKECARYFVSLTGSWLRLAYGKQIPSDQQMIELCDTWPFQKNGGVR